jgi:hypothetical protein
MKKKTIFTKKTYLTCKFLFINFLKQISILIVIIKQQLILKSER